MLSRTIEKLQPFVGKVCSIISVAVNRNFDERIAREHFVVMIQEINQDGIWGSHPYNPDLFSFFAFPHIVSIHEEVELDPNNPEHQDIIKKYEEKVSEESIGDLLDVPQIKKQHTNQDTSVFVDIEGLETLAAQTKKAFDRN